MMSDFDKRRLRFIVTPTRFYPDSVAQDVVKAYECWKQVWGHAFAEEMNVNEVLHSDHFTRKSHLAVLFHGEVPLGVCTSNVLDLSIPQDRDDSYFKVFPTDIYHQFLVQSPLIITCCNATINFEYRKNRLGLPGLDLLFGMMIRYLKSSPAEMIVGTARLQKGVEKVCYRTAATCLAKDLPYTIPGQRIDLVAWKKELDMSSWSPELLDVTGFVWEHATSVIQPIQKGERYAA